MKKYLVMSFFVLLMLVSVYLTFVNVDAPNWMRLPASLTVYTFIFYRLISVISKK